MELNLDVVACRAAGGAGLLADVKETETAHRIDFDKPRRSGKDYRAALGRNTRRGMSRAMRLYAERGPVEHRIMETPLEALAAFDLLAGYHQARWGRTGAFANPGLRTFHADLIARGIPAGAVRMSRTLAGDRTIGVLFNFVHERSLRWIVVGRDTLERRVETKLRRASRALALRQRAD
jgi:CelD/BcsL family acetyltransferase involved in cellulose biosynthesis